MFTVCWTNGTELVVSRFRSLAKANAYAMALAAMQPYMLLPPKPKPYAVASLEGYVP
jgi:hypothetical protein